MRVPLFSLCGFLLSAGTVCGAAVNFRDLPHTRLPYGEAVTIAGTLSGLTVKVEEAGQEVDKILTDFMLVTKVALTYTVSGLAPVNVEGNLNGDNWSVVTEKLPENAQVKFRFQFSGQLKEAFVKTVLNNLFTDPRFKLELDAFYALAAQRDAAVQVAGARNFLEKLAPVVESLLPAAFKAAAKNVTPAALVYPLANLKTNLQDMAANNVPGITAGMPPAAARDAVAAYERTLGRTTELTLADALAEKDSVKRGAMMSAAMFNENYTKLSDALTKAVVVEFEVSSDLTALAEVKDFEKYAGLDYGAVYLPRVDALRQFFTINVYFGAVEDRPLGVTGPAEWFRQRLSLTFGMSVGDLSSQASSKIKGDNAFLYGLGFRLNKYFRITAGAAAFRDRRNDRLSHGFMVGPSIDLTAFRYIRTIFGKESSRD